MIHFENYVRPKSFQEAYALAQDYKNVVCGGMMWLHLSDARYDTCIDLCDLQLDKIEEEDGYFKIGAMVSLSELENHVPIKDCFGTAFEDCLKHIVGVQFRNGATLGGSICAKLGFSDVLTLLLPLKTRVVFHRQGEMTLEEFLGKKNERDILKYVLIPKKKVKVRFQSVRRTYTDLPVINVCGVKDDGGMIFAVGARPNVAVLVKEGQRPEFGSNRRGSKEYREHLYDVLVKRIKDALEED
ncbi:MAG: FAD binding domain-containing protein [Erysipelotrichaceae bacterium]|nr:FAD binding domain-containing protein [Erysipelotrichaceae bacterium]